MGQKTLLEKYCIDTSAILDFWSNDRYTPYPLKVGKFMQLWKFIEVKVTEGVIVIPKVVHSELTTRNKELKEWLNKNKKSFIDEREYIPELKSIVNHEDFYTTDRASLNDAHIIAIAMGRRITVVTSEKYDNTPSKVKPKIPNICEALSVDCINLSDFFEREGQ